MVCTTTTTTQPISFLLNFLMQSPPEQKWESLVKLLEQLIPTTSLSCLIILSDGESSILSQDLFFTEAHCVLLLLLKYS